MNYLNAFLAETNKIRHSRIVWVTFVAFSIGPLMGGLIMVLLSHPDTFGQSGVLQAKAQMMSFTVDLNSYLKILTQVVGVGGVLVFGFVVSWIFGREYAEGTAKDLLALPVSRREIIDAKFIVYFLWCLSLAISNFLSGLIIWKMTGLGRLDGQIIFESLLDYFLTTIMVIATGIPVSFFALWGRGFMAPTGFVALTLVFSQIIGALGAGHYFPWSLPGLFSGVNSAAMASINWWSFAILILTSLAGYVATQYWWIKADQH